MKELVARKNSAGGAIDQDVHNKNQANMPEIAHNEHQYFWYTLTYKPP